MRDLSYKMVFIANNINSGTSRYDETDIREDEEAGLENCSRFN